MSRFIDELCKVGQKSTTPMGFGSGTASTSDDSQMILAASVSNTLIVNNPTLANASTDVFLVSGEGQDLDRIDSTLTGKIWGVRSCQFTATQGTQLAEKGCDFIVFESMLTEASLLNLNDLGIVATLSSEMSEETIRSISDLQIDAVLYSPPLRTLPMTIEVASNIQKVLSLLDKPIIVEAPEGAGSPELELLRNIGVASVLVGLRNKKQLSKLSKVKDDIRNLPKPRIKRVDRSAILRSEDASVESHDDDPHDDEDY